MKKLVISFGGSLIVPEKMKVLVVDYNPEVIESLSKEGFDCVYGDASDIELLIK